MTRTSKSGGCSFSFSERSPYITFWIILIFCTHYYTIYIMYSIPELPPPTLKNARYMVFCIFSLSPFLPRIFKVLNVFLGCSGGFQGQGIHWQQLRSFPKLRNVSFLCAPSKLLHHYFYRFWDPINECKSWLGVFKVEELIGDVPRPMRRLENKINRVFPPIPHFSSHSGGHI